MAIFSEGHCTEATSDFSRLRSAEPVRHKVQAVTDLQNGWMTVGRDIAGGERESRGYGVISRNGRGAGFSRYVVPDETI
jgi:hypothetical protein